LRITCYLISIYLSIKIIERLFMHNICVLGAGYMGSAMTFPLAQNGHDVNLWGTWLDDEIIDTCKKDLPHPKLNTRLPASVRLFSSGELEEAVRDCDIVFMGISSEGFLPVFKKLLALTDKNKYIFALTKGFVDDGGKIRRTTAAARQLIKERFKGGDFWWTSIGGPVKALELCRDIPTLSVYGSRTDKMITASKTFMTKNYRITNTRDITGVELSADFKNVYATGMGLVDGLYGPGMAGNYHNLSSFIFNQSVLEMSAIVEGAGGNKKTVFDNAGIGDLYVTSQSGRNRKFGYLIGGGSPPHEVYRTMLDSGELAEGYHTLKLGRIWLEENHPHILEDLPLFSALYQIIFGDMDPMEGIAGVLDRL
jgi:glycerol-3-phosphate dehydrogenase (NAD(P)+)